MNNTDDTLTAPLRRGLCPDCGGRGFVIGPQGGSATNIECANVGCRSRFNATFYGGDVVFAQRIERTSAWPSEPRSAEDAGIVPHQLRQMHEDLAASMRHYRRAHVWFCISSSLMVIALLSLVAKVVI